METKILEGQVAVVTGGSRGIGREVARALAMAGAKVAVTARNEAKLAETVAIIEEAGGICSAFVMDVSDYDSIMAGMAAIKEQYGKIDVLVNNAGIGAGGIPPWEVDVDEWWKVQEVNVKGVYICSQAVLPEMAERGSGCIINMGSLAGTRPDPFGLPYAVSKAALMRLTDSFAVAAKEYGVSVFVISPGLVRTDMTNIPVFDDVPDDQWTPIELSGILCVNLASGKMDKLSGCFIHCIDDLDDLLARADEIIESKSRQLTMEF